MNRTDKDLELVVKLLQAWAWHEVEVDIGSAQAGGGGFASVTHTVLRVTDVEQSDRVEAIHLGLIDISGREVATLAIEEGLLDKVPELGDAHLTLNLGQVVVTFHRIAGRRSQGRQERAAAAARIDPRTAQAWSMRGQLFDPYGEGHLPPDCDQIGKNVFLFDPQERYWITEEDVRELHPAISDDEWRAVMDAAFERSQDESRGSRYG